MQKWLFLFGIGLFFSIKANAVITDPSAVNFCNTEVRPMADVLASHYYSCKKIVNDWNANNMSSLITNTSDIIVDGSAQDGRHQITGAQVTNIITRCNEVITDYEASSNAKLNTVLPPAVNFGTKF